MRKLFTLKIVNQNELRWFGFAMVLNLCVVIQGYADPSNALEVFNFEYFWDFESSPTIAGDSLGFDLYNNTTGHDGADGVADFLLNSGAAPTYSNGILSLPAGSNVFAQLWPAADDIHGTSGYTAEYRVRTLNTSGLGVSIYESPNGSDAISGISLLNNGGNTDVYYGIDTAGQSSRLRASLPADQFVNIRVAAEYAPGQPGNHLFTLYIDGKRAGTDLTQSRSITGLDRLVFGDIGTNHAGSLEIDHIGFVTGAYSPGITYHPSVTPFAFDRDSGNPFPSSDGSLFNIRNVSVNGTTQSWFRTSQDDGQTWQTQGIVQVHTDQEGDVAGGMTRQIDANSFVHVYRDPDSFSEVWDHANHVPRSTASYDMWSIRSDDGGQTWTDRQKILNGYTGAFINMTVTSAGTIIAPLADFDTSGGRGIIRTLYSNDKGATWQQGTVMDLADVGIFTYGSEDGVLEPTVAERADGSLLMLMRTTQGFFWQATSSDQGQTWENFQQTSIEAGSSPGTLITLSNGDLALIYNQLTPEYEDNFDNFARDDIDVAANRASYFREEKSIIYSSDGGLTWTDPLVFASLPGGRLQYSEMFERRSGEIWMRVGGQWLSTTAIPEPSSLGILSLTVLGLLFKKQRRV